MVISEKIAEKIRQRRTPKSVYDKFVEFEERAASVYLHLAVHFSQNAELSSLWLEMGMQEKQHAGLLQFCAAECLFAPDLPSDAEIESAERLFAGLKKRASQPDLTVADAFEIAMEMEESEVNTIYDRLTTGVHQSMYLLRRKIVTMPNHIERLRREARKYGVAEKRAS